MMHRLAAVLALVLAGGCTFVPREQPAASDSTEIEATLEALLEAYDEGDVDSVASFFTADALLMPPGAPSVRGRAAVSAYVLSGVALGGWVQSAATDTLIESEDSALQVGTFSLHFGPDNGVPERLDAPDQVGRFMIHWERSSGRWRIARHIANRTEG